MSDVSARLQMAIERIRPALQLDGGDLRLVDFDPAEGRVRVQLSGACAGCSHVATTMTMGVERVLRSLVPEIRQVETVE